MMLVVIVLSIFSNIVRIFLTFSVPTTLVTDLKQLSCTFDNNLCGWKANPKAAGDPIFTTVKPVVNKNLGPASDFNTGSTSGGFFKHAYFGR